MNLRHIIVLLGILQIGLAYNSTLALELAYMSSIAYSSSSSIQNWNCNYCSKYKLLNVSVIQNTKQDILCFVGYQQSLNSVVVALRGTVITSYNNWIRDLSIIQKSYPQCSGCSVHSGFYNGYKLVQASIQAKVSSLLSQWKNANILIAGHSLGGALGIISAAHLQKKFNKVSYLYTYGQPRVGDRDFSKYIQSKLPNKIFRVIHDRDVVPHVPSSLVNYYHSGTQVWYKDDMTSFKTCKSQTNSCANSVKFYNYQFGDHSLVNYLKMKPNLFAHRLQSILVTPKNHLREDGLTNEQSQ